MSFPNTIVVNLSSSGNRLGGAALAAEWHSRYLAKHYPVELWRMWNQDETFSIDNLSIINYKTISRFGLFSRFIPRQLDACFLTSNILEDLVRIKPKIVHLQNPVPAIDFRRIAKKCTELGIKTVASTHGFFEVLNPNYEWKFYQKLGWDYLIKKPLADSFQFLDVILSGYPQEKEVLISNGLDAGKIHLVPNGVNPFFLSQPSLEEKKAVLERFDIPQNHPILLFIGNHTGNKGLSTVMQVAAHISKPVTIVVGGKCLMDNEPDYWQAKIPSANHVRVIFTDYLSLEQQRALYALSTLLLFPSLADTLPLTIIEAMACYLPVVAYDVGGISYQLDHHSGLVVKSGDTQAFIASVEFLLDHPEQLEKLAINAKKRQERLFSWDVASTKTIDIYKYLLSFHN
jgi:glycosyltransferase involved in cell wall biosynthesis